MTDIVERLRLIDPTLELRYSEDVTRLHEIGLWCHEAADEIDQLRFVLRYIMDNYDEEHVFHRMARIALGEKW